MSAEILHGLVGSFSFPWILLAPSMGFLSYFMGPSKFFHGSSKFLHRSSKFPHRSFELFYGPSKLLPLGPLNTLICLTKVPHGSFEHSYAPRPIHSNRSSKAGSNVGPIDLSLPFQNSISVLKPPISLDSLCWPILVNLPITCTNLKMLLFL